MDRTILHWDLTCFVKHDLDSMSRVLLLEILWREPDTLSQEVTLPCRDISMEMDLERLSVDPNLERIESERVRFVRVPEPELAIKLAVETLAAIPTPRAIEATLEE